MHTQRGTVIYLLALIFLVKCLTGLHGAVLVLMQDAQRCQRSVLSLSIIEFFVASGTTVQRRRLTHCASVYIYIHIYMYISNLQHIEQIPGGWCHSGVSQLCKTSFCVEERICTCCQLMST